MRKQNYYLASRDPSRGGLKIIKTNRDFPDEYSDFIEKNCLEIVVPEYSRNALMIYPLGNGENVVSLARKVKGDKWESRVHENIHGYVAGVEEFSKKYVSVMAERGFDDCFYHGKIEEAERLADEEFFYRPLECEVENLENFWASMSCRDTIGFFHAVYKVISVGEKIQLVVPAQMRRVVQAACYDILPYYCRDRLFTISDGECTQTDADILFVDEIQYQDVGRYQKMDLHTFIEEGISWRKRGYIRMDQLVNKGYKKRAEIYGYIHGFLKGIERNADKKTDELLMSIPFYDLLMELIVALENSDYQEQHKEELVRKFENVTAGNKKIQKLLCKEFKFLVTRTEEKQTEVVKENEQIAICLKYLKLHSSKTTISTVRNFFYEKEDRKGWENFQKELRIKLEETPLLSKQREHYVSLLFLAYESYRGRCMNLEPAVLLAPYDLEGMLMFLRRKSKSQWEYKKYVEEVLRQYAEVFLLYIPERKVKGMARKLKGSIGKYLTEDVGDYDV